MIWCKVSMHLPRSAGGRRILAWCSFLLLASAASARADDTRPTPAPPREILSQRAITVDEAVAIALEYQPNILARLGDYAAAKFRVDQALSPLLPQLTAAVTTTKS